MVTHVATFWTNAVPYSPMQHWSCSVVIDIVWRLQDRKASESIGKHREASESIGNTEILVVRDYFFFDSIPWIPSPSVKSSIYMVCNLSPESAKI